MSLSICGLTGAIGGPRLLYIWRSHSFKNGSQQEIFFGFGCADIEQTLELDYRDSIEQFSRGLLLIYDDLIWVLRGGLSWVVETYCQGQTD